MKNSKKKSTGSTVGRKMPKETLKRDKMSLPLADGRFIYLELASEQTSADVIRNGHPLLKENTSIREEFADDKNFSHSIRYRDLPPIPIKRDLLPPIPIVVEYGFVAYATNKNDLFLIDKKGKVYKIKK